MANFSKSFFANLSFYFFLGKLSTNNSLTKSFWQTFGQQYFKEKFLANFRRTILFTKSFWRTFGEQVCYRMFLANFRQIIILRKVSGELLANNFICWWVYRKVNKRFATESPLASISGELLIQCFGELNGLPQTSPFGKGYLTDNIENWFWKLKSKYKYLVANTIPWLNIPIHLDLNMLGTFWLGYILTCSLPINPSQY